MLAFIKFTKIKYFLRLIPNVCFLTLKHQFFFFFILTETLRFLREIQIYPQPKLKFGSEGKLLCNYVTSEGSGTVRPSSR